ncbi:MAG: OmpH family outer membrane protein [Gammaproteobacteria bacterium]|nr:OmpH family outer membrane protein [Gammaproteobacteria bacterium]
MLLASAPAWLPAQELKIGFVNSAKIVENSPQYDEARQLLQTEFKSRESDLVAKQKRLQELEQKLQKDGTSMDSEERGRLEKDILSRTRKLNNDRAAFREDFNLRRNEESNRLRMMIGETIREYAKANNYDLVVEDGVVHFSERIDLTDKILKELGAK